MTNIKLVSHFTIVPAFLTPHYAESPIIIIPYASRLPWPRYGPYLIIFTQVSRARPLRTLSHYKTYVFEIFQTVKRSPSLVLFYRPFKMPSSYKCSSCASSYSESKTLRQHVWRKHAQPIPFTLPNGTIEQLLIKDDARYQCWCHQSFSTREGAVAHVTKVHVSRSDWPVNLFKTKSGTLYCMLLVMLY